MHSNIEHLSIPKARFQMEEQQLSSGLVLSGGGYKGIAHAGVLQFLDEEGIRPTKIAGTSAGSIVAGLYAFGIKPPEILDFFKSVNIFNWHHFTIKKAGIMDAYAFHKYLNKIFNDHILDDLEIPLYITATDIVRGKLKIFSPETKIADALLASSAFPGVFSPFKIEDRLYSDGGILNNFPSNILQGRCDYIIGVNVCPLQEIEEPQLTSIKSVTARAYELMTTLNNYQKIQLCDWIIEPKALTEYSTFERNRNRMDQIYEIGYLAAKESFQEKKHNFKNLIL